MPSLDSDKSHSPLNRALQPDRRRCARYEVSIAVQVLTTDGVPLSAEMTNVSGSGFRARSPITMAPGTRILVRFPGRLPRKAEIAWQRGLDIGCRFLRPISIQQLAELAGG